MVKGDHRVESGPGDFVFQLFIIDNNEFLWLGITGGGSKVSSFQALLDFFLFHGCWSVSSDTLPCMDQIK
jgi:hypothetical protein